MALGRRPAKLRLGLTRAELLNLAVEYDLFNAQFDPKANVKMKKASSERIENILVARITQSSYTPNSFWKNFSEVSKSSFRTFFKTPTAYTATGQKITGQMRAFKFLQTFAESVDDSIDTFLYSTALGYMQQKYKNVSSTLVKEFISKLEESEATRKVIISGLKNADDTFRMIANSILDDEAFRLMSSEGITDPGSQERFLEILISDYGRFDYDSIYRDIRDPTINEYWK